MKRILSILFLLSIFACPAFAQLPAQHGDTDCAEIALSKDTIDLGTIHIDAYEFHNITIKSVGTCPLIIYSVEGGGPREYAYNKSFYQHGDTGLLGILYQANKPGPIARTYIINSNAKHSRKYIYIKGEVVTGGTCAKLTFDKDTLNLGGLPYLFGKHTVINVYNKGTCPMMFQARTDDDMLNMLGSSTTAIQPGDTGKIDIHIGGQYTGDYYGEITTSSVNIVSGLKTLYIKGNLLPPAKTDTNDTEIKVEKDIFDFGTVCPDSAGIIVELTAKLKITNIGKKPLVLVQENSKAVHIANIPIKPVMPGQSVTVSPAFFAGGTPDTNPGAPPVLQHVVLSGNFPGKNMPIYGRWYYKKKS